MFWSAVTICAKPEDLQYWAGLLPGDTVFTTLQTLIKDEEQQVRLGAVSALPALPDVGKKLAAVCVTVALEDRIPSVRRAAGQSLAALDCREETAVINERLRHKGRRQAVEILGDFYDAGKQLEGLPFWWRWLGRRESRARAMERHRTGDRCPGQTGRCRRRARGPDLVDRDWTAIHRDGGLGDLGPGLAQHGGHRMRPSCRWLRFLAGCTSAGRSQNLPPSRRRSVATGAGCSRHGKTGWRLCWSSSSSWPWTTVSSRQRSLWRWHSLSSRGRSWRFSGPPCGQRRRDG